MQFRLDKLGYVFQSYALLPELTTLESVFLPLMIAGVNKNVYMQNLNSRTQTNKK